MNRKRSIPAVLGAAVLVVTSAQAVGAGVGEEAFALNTTADLYEVCATTSDSDHFVPAAYECRGFIEGAVQYHDAVTDKKNLKRLICYPKDATIADGKRAFLDWGKKNSGDKKKMGEIPVVGLVRALADKYPCKG